MSLPSAKVLVERILSGYDRQYYDSLYTQMQYAFGQKWNTKASYNESGYNDIPVYHDVRTTGLQVGQSRRILNASIRTLSREMSRNAVPRFTQVDEVRSEVRKQFWLANANGDRGVRTKWLKQMQYAFVEGDTLGVGCVKHGLRTHPQTGLQFVDMRHVPVLQCLWDPFEHDPRNSAWVAVVSYVPFDVAVAKIGKKKAEAHKRFWTVQEGMQQLEYVRFIEYWDQGYAGHDPTYALVTGPLEADNTEASLNETGVIPVSFCVNYVAPGMRRPVGRVVMQMSMQELINDIEKAMRGTMKGGPPVDVLLADAFDEDDLSAFEAGDYGRLLKIKEGMVEDAGKAFSRVPGKEVPQGWLQLFGIAQQQYNDDSNQTEQSRGNALGARTTAREVMSLNARAQENASLTRQQTLEFQQDVIRGSMAMAWFGDLHPVDLDVFGSNVTFNDPRDPQSRIANFLDEDPGAILIDLEDAAVQDDDAKRQAKKEDLMFLAPLVGVTLDPQTYSDEVLEAAGEANLEKWRIKGDPGQIFQQATQPTEQ